MIKVYYDRLCYWAKANPNAVAVYTENGTMTYHTFCSKVMEMRLWVKRAFDLKVREAVLLNLKSAEETLCVLYALLSMGISAGVVSKDQAPLDDYIRSLKNDWDMSDIRLMTELPPVKEFELQELPDSLPGGRHIVFSSGSSAYCKMAVRTPASWSEAFETQNAIFSIAPGTRVMVAGSLAYTGNLNFVLGALYEGATVCISESVNPAAMEKYVSSYKPEVMYLVPTVLGLFLRRYGNVPSSLKTLVTAGEKLRESVLEMLLNKNGHLNIVEFYGTSELSYISAVGRTAQCPSPMTVGAPFPGVEIDIRNGDVWVRSPYAACGYEGWQFTGDTGFLKEDALCLNGRKGHVISKSGKMVDLSEIEGKAETHPDILRAAAIRIEDGKRGENYILAVECHVEKIKHQQVRAYLTRLLTGVMKPHKIVLMENFPAKEGGKLDKNEILSSIS